MNASRQPRRQHASTLIQDSQVPTLFRLAAESCARHIQLFGTLEGLPFEPFGQAILSAFIDLQDQLSTWQRQIGILVFAESYGYHHRLQNTPYRCSRAPGLVFSGLSQLSNLSELSLLASFAECLVYLDLSAPPLPSSSRVSLSDHDLVALASMKQLRMLNLAGQHGVGDIGLSHLISSAEFEVGLQKLEYLSMRHTGLTDQGLARLWRPMPKESTQPHRVGQPPPQSPHQHPKKDTVRCVWQHLLGIDLSGTHVHLEVARNLFAKAGVVREGSSANSVPATAALWHRLPADTILFAPLHREGDQSKVYLEPCSIDPVIEEQPHLSSLSTWAETLSAVDEKYTWVNIGTSNHSEHRISVADGLPAMMALLKMTSTYVQELPDDPPLPLYSSRAEDQHPWKRQRRRGTGGRRQREREDRVLLGQQQVIAKRPEAMIGSGLRVEPGRTSSGRRNQKMMMSGKQGVEPLIFVRDRASVLEELAQAEERDWNRQGDDEDGESGWGSQATLVDHPMQQRPMESQFYEAPPQFVARIRRPHHHNVSGSPLLVDTQGSTRVQLPDELSAATPPPFTAQQGLSSPPAPRRKKRVWMPSAADVPSSSGRDGKTAASPAPFALSPFVKVVKQEKRNGLTDDDDGLFATTSGQVDEDDPMAPALASSPSPFSASTSVTRSHSDWAVGQEADTKRLAATLTTGQSKSKKVKVAPRGSFGVGEVPKNNLLTMWANKGEQSKSSVTSSTDQAREKGTGLEQPSAIHSSASGQTLQGFYFVDDEHKKKKTQVSLNKWLGAGGSSDGHDKKSSRDRGTTGAQVDTAPPTLWMRRVHEEGMTLSRSLSMSKKDARTSIRQVLPDGIKVPASFVKFDSDSEE
ncbi:hypothetical protein DFQ26_008250 [Actinomortierella ambigua]|nr:hypothetical protein DFQ26_008250 [Actinomortierella ambigua]